jgi:hypothetical protein
MSNESDRERLELAAKAAGITYHDELGGWKHEDWCRYWSDGEFCTCGGEWNPLTDDGDALRLAVKLGIPFEVDYGVKEAIVRGRFGIDIGSDPCAATRRAIVRAAAEIGKTMNGDT